MKKVNIGFIIGSLVGMTIAGILFGFEKSLIVINLLLLGYFSGLYLPTNKK